MSDDKGVLRFIVSLIWLSALGVLLLAGAVGWLLHYLFWRWLGGLCN